MIVQDAAFLLAAGSDLRCAQTLTGSGSSAEETASGHLNKALDRTTMEQKNTNGLLIAA